MRSLLCALSVATVVASSAPVLAAKPKVVLLEAGKAPKTKLRFSPKVGDTQNVDFDMGMSMTMRIGEMKMPKTQAPTTTMTMKTVVTKVAKNGDITYSFEFTKADIKGESSMPPQAVESLKGATKELVGTKGSGTISNTGFNLGTSFALPATASPSAKQTLEGMRSTLEQFAAPMPTEPVGVGGKWRVEFETKQMGIAIRQHMTYVVKSIEKGRAVFGVTVEQSAASDSAAMPGLPPGVNAQLESLESKGQGDVTVDLGHVAPMESAMQIAMMMVAKISANGQAQSMAMDMDLAVILKSR